MRVSFPHMGNLYISLGALLKEFGFDVVVPPKPSRNSLEKAVKYSPEWMCVPFKANLGDLLNTVYSGTDALVSVGGCWSCRFGYYGRLHHQILKDMGENFVSIILFRDGPKEVYKRVKEINGGITGRAVDKLWYGIRLCWSKSKAVEIAEKIARETRPYEINIGETTRVLESILNDLDMASTLEEVRNVKKDIKFRFSKISKDTNREPLKVKLVGEIYLVLEPMINFDVERRLGEMGVYVDPYFTIHKWLVHPFHLDRREENLAKKEAVPYSPFPLGGEEQLSVGFTVIAARDGYDGVLHLQPFTCMPESMVQPILQRLSRKYNIPVMSISLDEHSGETGFLTRLEAFVDLLKERRKKKLEGLSWN